MYITPHPHTEVGVAVCFSDEIGGIVSYWCLMALALDQKLY